MNKKNRIHEKLKRKVFSEIEFDYEIEITC